MSTGVLHRKTLVLNRNWVPVNAITVQDAIVKACSERAKILDTETMYPHTFVEWIVRIPKEGALVLRSVHVICEVPSVITLTDYDQYPDLRVVFNRRNLYIRDKYECQYCGCKPGTKELSIDHVVPTSRGGRTCWENCVLSCTACNSIKADRMPGKAGMTLKKKPMRPRWHMRYVLKVRRIPEDWAKFLGVDMVYWNAELEHDE